MAPAVSFRADGGWGEQEDHENTLPLVGRVSGQVRLYEEGGRGGAERDGHHMNREGTRAVTEADTIPGRRLATRRGTHDHCGGRRLPRAPQESRGHSSVRPARYQGDD